MPLPYRKTTTLGRNVLVRRESLELVAYADVKGIPTVGIGHAFRYLDGTPIQLGDRITTAEAIALFDHDLGIYEAPINALAVSLADNEFDALVSFCFNVGIGAFKRSTLAALLRAGDKHAAAEQFKKWVHPDAVTHRRMGEQLQFVTPYAHAKPVPRAEHWGTMARAVRVTATPGPPPLGPAPTPPAAPWFARFFRRNIS